MLAGEFLKVEVVEQPRDAPELFLRRRMQRKYCKKI
jgi:hypothetical protein